MVRDADRHVGTPPVTRDTIAAAAGGRDHEHVACRDVDRGARRRAFRRSRRRARRGSPRPRRRRRRRDRTAGRGGGSTGSTPSRPRGNASRRTAPSPPRHRPRRPSRGRIANASTSTGKRLSSTSGSVRRLLVMCVWTALGAGEARPRARRRRRSFRNIASRSSPKVRLFIVPWRGRHHAERAEQRVGDDLADLDVAGDDRRRIDRVEHRTRRDDQRDRAHAAVVQRDVVVDQAAEDVQHRGAHDAARRVEIARQLRARAGEVDRRGAVRAVDRHGDADRRAVVDVVGEAAVGEAQRSRGGRLPRRWPGHAPYRRRRSRCRRRRTARRDRPRRARRRRPAPSGR